MRPTITPRYVASTMRDCPCGCDQRSACERWIAAAINGADPFDKELAMILSNDQRKAA